MQIGKQEKAVMNILYVAISSRCINDKHTFIHIVDQIKETVKALPNNSCPEDVMEMSCDLMLKLSEIGLCRSQLESIKNELYTLLEDENGVTHEEKLKEKKIQSEIMDVVKDFLTWHVVPKLTAKENMERLVEQLKGSILE